MKKFLTTSDLMEVYRFPNRQQVRQFLAYHSTEITVHKRGRVLLVEEREFEAFMRRERRRQLRSRVAEFERQPLHPGTQSLDVHSEESTETSAGLHPKPFGVTA